MIGREGKAVTVHLLHIRFVVVMMPGGVGGAQPMTEEVSTMVVALRSATETSAGVEFAVFEPIQYSTQVTTIPPFEILWFSLRGSTALAKHTNPVWVLKHNFCNQESKITAQKSPLSGPCWDTIPKHGKIWVKGGTWVKMCYFFFFEN